MKFRAKLAGCLALLVSPAALYPGADDHGDGVVPIRIGASTSLVGADVNATDARAALVVWSDALSRGTGIRVEHLPEVMSPPDQLYQRIRQGDLDVFACSVAEYLHVVSYTDPGLVLIDQSYADGGEQYLILTHVDSGIRSVSDLRGRSLSRYSANAMTLAPDWLETVLAGLNLGPSANFFKQMTQNPKAARAVLPVFFRQEDACLVNRRAFDSLTEMNPQLAVKLRIIAASPKIVPILVAVHKNCSALQKERLQSALTAMNRNAGGRQILTLFGSKGLIAVRPAVLDSAIEIIKASTRPSKMLATKD